MACDSETTIEINQIWEKVGQREVTHLGKGMPRKMAAVTCSQRSK